MSNVQKPKLFILSLVLTTLLVGGAIAFVEISRQPQERVLHVKGMVCNSCAEDIQEELAALPGVKEVTVSQKEGTVRMIIDGWSPPSDDAIGSAIKEAGYELAGEHDASVDTKGATLQQ
ncbi:MAG: cation transporter [Planctomycetota bacterium]|nr:cation transporter [Planctomycetota bacterium]